VTASHLLLRAWLRDWTRHPLQRLLTILGVVIAVAVVLAVDLANQSAQRAFDRSMIEVAGAATHQVLGPVEGFSEDHYRDLRLQGWRDIAPIVEGPLRLASGETIYLLGIDPLAEAPFREGAASFGAAPIQRLLTEPGTVLVPPHWLEDRSIREDEDRVVLVTPAGEREVTVLGAPEAGEDARVWIADIATAQVLLDRVGHLDRIDARLDAPDGPAALEAALPAGLDLVPVAARDAAARELAQAFRINLTAMSLLALLIAAFLIYNTQTFSVLRRLEVLADLRLIGVSRQQVMTLVLIEALLVGLVGTLLGAVAGVVLAQALVEQVALTVSDHFFAVAVTAVEPRPLALAAVVALGLGLSLVSALAPAWEAAQERGVGGSGRAALEARAKACPLFAGRGRRRPAAGCGRGGPGNRRAGGRFRGAVPDDHRLPAAVALGPRGGAAMAGRGGRAAAGVASPAHRRQEPGARTVPQWSGGGRADTGAGGGHRGQCPGWQFPR